MENPNLDPIQKDPRASAWASPGSKFQVSGLPKDAVNLNVDGRMMTNPLKGFGQAWQKTYRVRLTGVQVTPQEVIQRWKEEFPKFWPEGNSFYGSSQSITPGDVAVLNLSAGFHGVGGMPVISTGIMVIYADDESFTFATPQGHMFSGWITFSSYEEDGSTVAQITALIRASDPIFEVSFRLLGSAKEDEFWQYTLNQLSKSFGVNGHVQMTAVLLDPKVQWSEAGNIWHNAGVRTMLYTVGTPFRAMSRQLNGKGKP